MVDQLVGALSFAPQDRVHHGVFGAGVVQRLTPESVTVLFDDAGYHTLSLALVREHDLLSRIASKSDQVRTAG